MCIVNCTCLFSLTNKILIFKILSVRPCSSRVFLKCCLYSFVLNFRVGCNRLIDCKIVWGIITILQIVWIFTFMLQICPFSEAYSTNIYIIIMTLQTHALTISLVLMGGQATLSSMCRLRTRTHIGLTKSDINYLRNKKVFNGSHYNV